MATIEPSESESAMANGGADGSRLFAAPFAVAMLGPGELR
jgi:hypothetical protein